MAKLNDAVRAGTKQLHVNAVCPIPKTATTQSRHNEATHNLVRQLEKIISVSER
nr:lysis system i-spanin subunit Rz [Candidatus Arsenophonus triatominarum]